jgi:hypothetical protein
MIGCEPVLGLARVNDALYPSKSGLINKHTVKHTECNAVASYLGFGTLQFSGSLGVNDPFLGALCPSKSGLMNKHIAKHIVSRNQLNPALCLL